MHEKGQKETSAMRKNVQQGDMAANWGLDGNKDMERGWFA
jgi:hypothetical protein